MAPKKLKLNITKLKTLAEDQAAAVKGGGPTSSTCNGTNCPKTG
jgi:hypothetical protein